MDAFIDSGSTFSYVDLELAKALDLKILGRKRLHINRFPNETFETETLLVLVNFPIIGWRPFLTMPNLRSAMKVAALNEAEISELKSQGLTLQRDPGQEHTVFTEFLIGQSLINEIADNEKRTVKLKSGITIYPTIFGNYYAGGRVDEQHFLDRQHQ